VALPKTFNPPRKKTYNAYRRIIQSSDEDSDIEFVKDSLSETSQLVEDVLEVEDSEEEAVPNIRGTGPFQPKGDGGIIILWVIYPLCRCKH